MQARANYYLLVMSDLCRIFVSFWYWITQGCIWLFLLIKSVLLSLIYFFSLFSKETLNCFSGERFSIPFCIFLVCTPLSLRLQSLGEKKFKNRSGSHVMNKIYAAIFFPHRAQLSWHPLHLRVHRLSCSYAVRSPITAPIILRCHFSSGLALSH